MGYKRAINKMKKFTFILAALFAATFANAQITLEHTFEGKVLIQTGATDYTQVYTGFGNAPYYFSYKEFDLSMQVQLYDLDTYTLYKTVNHPLPTKTGSNFRNCYIAYVTKDIFTTDGKVAFILMCRSEESDDFCKVIDEDGNVVATLNPGIAYVFVTKINDSYKLVAQDWDSNENPAHTFIYSLPGNGEPNTNISTPSSPKRSARKIARDGQVLIETDTNTYTLQGTEVK